MRRFHVPDMTCGHCSSAIEKAIRAKDPEAQVHCDIGSGHVSVQSSLGTAAVQGAISDAGYHATAVAGT